MPQSESQILAQTLLALSATPGVRVWRNQTGCLPDRFGRVIKFGLVGSADILGLIGPTGRFLAVECKTVIGRQSTEQINFQRMIMRHGGVYLLVRSADDAVKQLHPYLSTCACDSSNMVNGPASAPTTAGETAGPP